MTRPHPFPTLVLCAALLLLAGCGGRAAGSPIHPRPQHRIAQAATATPAPSQPVDTPTTVPLATATQTSRPLATSTSTPAPPTSMPAPAPAAPQVVSASISPATAVSGASLSIRVQLRGRASRVELYLSSGPGGSGPLTYTLSALGASAWAGSGAAPTTSGTYHYSVGLYDLSGNRTVADDDAWNITIHAASQASGPQPLPPDVPLAPPFSYGNPQTAVFSAEGRTVNGSEVVSSSRPDIAASIVAQWYMVHLPRAGWTVVSGGVPGAGAISFTISATTAGNRVCVVSFSGGVVQIYYGSFSS